MEGEMGREVAVWWGPDSILSALGFGTRENMEAVRAGRTNLSAWHDGTPVCQIDPERFAQLTAERAVAEYTPAERLALLTLGVVIARSGVSPANERTLVLLSTTKGNIGLLNGDPAKCDLNDTAEVVGRHFGAANRPLVISNACISGVSAIVVASRLIRSGEYDHVFVAGFDLLCDFIVSGFNAFKSVSPALCRPYDAARDGLTLGEAGGAVLLTTDRELSATGITVAGGGISNDANHISAPSRTGDGLAFAIGAALREASLGAAAIGMVNPHGTATLYNDEMESRALHLAGLCGTPCNSLKPYFGHTLGASGVIESIVTVHGLAEGTVFGVKGYAECGVPYPLNISAEHRTTRTDAALKTASGFGGCNAAAVFRRGTGRNAYGTDETGSTDENAAAERSDVFGGRYCDGENPARQDGTNGAETDRDDAQNKRRQETAGGQPGFTGADESNAAANVGQKECAAANENNVITNAGQAGGDETEEIRTARDTAHVAITRHPEMPFGVFIRERYRALADPNMKFSKMDDLCKLAYVASCELLAGRRPDCPAERIGVVLANRSASLDSDMRHQAVIDADDGGGASPAVFVYTLPNIMLGQIAIKHGLKGESTFFAFPDKSCNFIRKYAEGLIAQGRMDAVVWGWCELCGGEYDCELTLTEKLE